MFVVLAVFFVFLAIIVGMIMKGFISHLKKKRNDKYLSEKLQAAKEAAEYDRNYRFYIQELELYEDKLLKLREKGIDTKKFELNDENNVIIETRNLLKAECDALDLGINSNWIF